MRPLTRPAETSPKRSFASILVDAGGPAARRPFDYVVPPELCGRVRPGSLVVVPLGPRFVRGVVVELKDHPEVADVKPVRELYPQAGLADRLAPELSAFVAARYACSRIEAYRAILPGAIGGRPTRAWMVGEAPGPPPGTLDPELDRVYGLVQARGTRNLAQIRGALGLSRHAAARAVKVLERAGLLAPAAEVSVPPVKDRVPLFAVDEVAAAAQLPALSRRAPRQAELLEEILGRTGSFALDELPPGPGPRRALRGLEARGLVSRAGLRPPSPGEDPVSGLGGPANPLALTADQAKAVEAITRAVLSREAREFLLYGVTGSGKTEVYLQAIAVALASGWQALALVPEIALTPQAVTRFSARFPGEVAVLHSRLAAGDRSRAWRDLAGGRARICIGPRSAVFAPMPDLGLIVIDEEHEGTYKQEDIPRYDAREVARERSRLAGVPLVFGSATPSLELFWRASGQGRPDGASPTLLELPRRLDGRALPDVALVDMRQELARGNRALFSRRLQAAIAARLGRSEQVVLLLNRRGLATFVLCRDCGYVVRCPHCDVSLVFHGQYAAMHCHYCGYHLTPPAICPKCGSRRIRYFGAGTERVEALAKALFPQARVARLDLDVAARRGAAGEVLGAFARGEIDILVGTQIIGKGMDVPSVTLVGVVAADTALGLPDFRAAERTFSLVTQVAGRAGRGNTPGQVLVQTYCPEHYSLRHAAAHDYRGFYLEELEYRRELRYPPFAHLGLVRVSAPAAAIAEDAARGLFDELSRSFGAAGPDKEPQGGVQLLGPSPSPLARLQGQYRWNIVLKSEDPLLLAGVTSQVAGAFAARLRPGVRIAVDVDPQEIL